MLRQPLYAQLLSGNFVSSMGVWLYVAAAAWVMLELTGSPLMVGVVSGATFVPRVLFALPAGALIDVFDRRHMVIAGNLFQAGVSIAAGVLYARGQLGPWLLVVMTLGLGAGQALSMPAYHSVIQDVVPRALVASAVTIHSGSVNFARAAGPAIGGALIAAGQTELAFVLNGVSYFAICAAALRIPKPEATGHSPESIGHAMRTGLRFVRHSPLLLQVFLASALFSLTSTNLQTLLAPASVARGLGAQGYGLLFSCFGIGALLGALATRRLAHVAHRHMQPLAISVFGVSGLGFAYVPGVWLAMLIIALAGAAWVATFSTFNTMVQLTAPAWVRGRVLSLYMMGFTCAMPLGSVISGALADNVGVRDAIALMSFAVIAVAVVTWLLALPAVHDIEVAHNPEDWPSPDHAPNVQGGPVAVLVTWTVAAKDIEPFLQAMVSVRRSRLRSGAFRWTLCHDPDHPEELTELFEVPDWEEHLRQHGRLDREAVSSLRRARELDRNGKPRVLHLVGLAGNAASIPDGWTPVTSQNADGRAVPPGIPEPTRAEHMTHTAPRTGENG